jgi:hypothetical protein
MESRPRRTVSNIHGKSYIRIIKARKFALIRKKRRYEKSEAKFRLKLAAVEAWKKQAESLPYEAVHYHEPKEPGIFGSKDSIMMPVFVILFLFSILFSALFEIGDRSGMETFITLLFGGATLLVYILGKVNYFFWTLPKWRKAKRTFSEEYPVFANVLWPTKQ